MKNHLLIFSVVILFLYSCQEKISPSLEDSAIETENEDTESKLVTVPESDLNGSLKKYYFQLTNDSDPLWGHHLHRTGSGNGSKGCVIDSDQKNLSNSDYSSEKIISCYLEAEELSLMLNGLNFSVEASPDTCAAIMYTPFSYYNDMPGSSTGTYHQLTCHEWINEENIRNLPEEIKNKLSDKDGVIDCSHYVSHDLDQEERVSFPKDTSEENISEQAQFCHFNNEVRQCDNGKVTINEIKLSFTNEQIDQAEASAWGVFGGQRELDPQEEQTFINLKKIFLNQMTPQNEIVKRVIDCGGKAYQCLEGPLKQMSPSQSTEHFIYNAESQNEILKKSFSYKGLFNLDLTTSTYYYANFKRELSNKNIVYRSFDNEDYVSSFSDDRFKKDFDSNVFLEYKNLIHPSGFDSFKNHVKASFELSQNLNNKYHVTPLAADPFLTYIPNDQEVDDIHSPHPFYTFECIDSGHDPIATIHLIVRDWDRVFAEEDHTSLDFEFTENISDVFQTELNLTMAPKMDYEMNNDILEIPFYDESYNDFKDWDDILMMKYNGSYYTPYNSFYSDKNFPKDCPETVEKKVCDQL